MKNVSTGNTKCGNKERYNRINVSIKENPNPVDFYTSYTLDVMT